MCGNPVWNLIYRLVINNTFSTVSLLDNQKEQPAESEQLLFLELRAVGFTSSYQQAAKNIVSDAGDRDEPMPMIVHLASPRTGILSISVCFDR